MIDALMKWAGQNLKHNLAACEVHSCGQRSPGVQCQHCKRHVCANHGFLALSVPPVPICVDCVVDSQREDTESEDVPDFGDT